MRYQQLLDIIKHNKPSVIVEVGTWNGDRAIMMAKEALKYRDEVFYSGYDLFEWATEETDARELNVKKHFSVVDVQEKLKRFRDENPGFNFALFEGDTRETLNFHGGEQIDLAFIDGGHSIETIKSDFEALKGAKVVVLDDYYVPHEGHPDITKYGCNFLIDGNEDAAILPQADPVKGGGKVRMAVIPKSAWPGKVNLVVKTQNCVPHEEIQANIDYSVPKIGKWIRECSRHDRTAIIVSAGPSLKDYVDEIEQRKKSGDYIVCVKHAHDELIRRGIIPDACMLLDPRSHVQDFIENPHPGVLYFVASMCHPTTLDRLIEREAKIIGYNAHVGAGEEKTLEKYGNHILVGGGSTSAIRGISVLYAMGFRKFKLYGFDSCYYEEPDFTEKTKTGQQKYVTVAVNGKEFWSDLELLAQAQDFEKLLKQGKDLDLEVFGEGMIPHIWNAFRKRLPEFEDVING